MKQKLEIGKAHELANVIAECEAAGVFTEMDAKTRADIENAHATANFELRLEQEELAEKPRKGMILSVYRSAGGVDCPLGGASAKFADILLVGPNVPEIFEEKPDRPAFVLGEISGRLHLKSADADPKGWYMHGGNFAHSCDSRVTELMPYPVMIFDRQEPYAD